MAAGRAAATETEPPAQGTAGAQGSARRCGARQAARGRLCAGDVRSRRSQRRGVARAQRGDASRRPAGTGRQSARVPVPRVLLRRSRRAGVLQLHARASPHHSTLKKRIRSPISCRAHPYRAEVSSLSHSSPSIVYIQLCPALYLPLSRKHTNSTENMLLVTSTLLRATNTTRCPRSSSRPSSRLSQSTPEWPSKCTCRGARRGTGVGRRGALL